MPRRPRPSSLAPVFAVIAMALLASSCALWPFGPARRSAGAAANATAFAPTGPPAFTLALAHVNDTHSALEPSTETLTLAGERIRVKLGGQARLKTALDGLRAANPGLLTLHAGDAVQGTLYFNVFNGAAEFDFLNALGVDAMTLGNHEFDRGPAELVRMLALARFPIVCANVDASAEPGLAALLRPFVVFNATTPGGARRVGVIGATTPDTPLITSDVGRVRFAPAARAVAAAARALAAQGVDIIILLSHNGYEADIELARTVPGLDVIVGGHSHTLLGDKARLAPLGLTPAGPYPTEVAGPEGARALVVQAWKWEEVLGFLRVRFDAAGRVQGYDADPALLAGGGLALPTGAALDSETDRYAALMKALTATGAARAYADDPAMLARLAPYAAGVAALQNAPIGARAAADLVRGTATDPGPLVADAYLAKVPEARISLVGSGGLRTNILAGELTMGQVMAFSPFGNTLVRLRVTGAQLKQALEETYEYLLRAHPPRHGEPGSVPRTHPGGFTYALRPENPQGGRISDLRLVMPTGGEMPLGMADTFILVTNSFLAGGGDGMAALKAVHSGRIDTGYVEHDVIAEYFRSLGTVRAPAGARVRVVLPAAGQRSGLGRWPWPSARGAGLCGWAACA